MNLATHAVILLCGIYICEAGYGVPAQDTQSDVEAPHYVPPYASPRNEYSKTYSSRKTYSYGSGTKTGYSGTKTAYSGTKTGYSGTKTSYSGTKTGHGGTQTSYGTKQTWHSSSGSKPTFEEFKNNANLSYEPKCEPQCKNNGICVDTNTCDCPPTYKGRYCEIEAKPCLSHPPLPMNSDRNCSSDYCTIRCNEGHRFAGLNTTIANMKCGVDGTWQPTIPLLAAIPDCVPQCTPPCLNGGVCLAVDTCQCPEEYKGPQCQYLTSACDYRKLGFNGAFRCTENEASYSCRLSCTAPAIFRSPPAESYTCTYESGEFSPQPIPLCVFPSNIHSTQTSFSYSVNSSHSSHAGNMQQESYKHQSGSYGHGQSGSYGHNSNYVHGDSNRQNGSYEYEVNTLEQQSGLTGGNNKVVVQDFNPKGGSCLTWAGVHYKTFDGKIYSFKSSCQHILLRHKTEHSKYMVTIKQGECTRNSYCPSELTVYLEDKAYVLSVSEDGSVLFSREGGRLIPIPASLPGIRVDMPTDYVIVNLDGEGVTVKWDTNNLVMVEGSVLLWNNTEGLCGTLDSNPDNDFWMNDGELASTDIAFASSWKLDKIGDKCPSNSAEASCAFKSSEDKRKAESFCSSIFSKSKFRRCSDKMDITQLLAACSWDYCACAATSNPEECACATVSVFAKECLRNGVTEMKTWRDSETCPIKCPEGKVYKACGADSQPSCAFPTINSNNNDNTTCVEGCFCPEGTFLESGKCLAKSDCPCRLRNKSFKPGTVLSKDCNTCACQEGEWVCTQAPCGARCSAVGDPHYTTFDGFRYDFMGHCTYDLMTTDNITIQVENVACSGAITEAMNLAPYKGEGKPSCTKSVKVKYNNVEIQLKQGGAILVGDQQVSTLPVKAGDVRIRTASSLFIIVQLPNKVDIWWDGATRIFVDVPPAFLGQTKGLCGTFNLNQKDDFLTPEGDVEQSAHAFANKWKTREFCEDVDVQEPEHPCKANIQNKLQAEKYCSKLKSKLFEECHWHVDVDPYYSSCVYDMCACADGDVSRCLCPVLGDYAMACAKQGVKVQWRYNVKECELSCSGGQEYTVCADSCERTCSDIAQADISDCKPCCVEGCACPPGQVLNDNNVCVPKAMCPCYEKGMKFDPGFKEVRPGRRERELCTCVGARWECVAATANDIQNYPPIEDIRANCSAANHMEFTTCLVAEPLTCKNMHVSPSTQPSECRAGCQCSAGHVLDATSGRCVPPAACPCHHGGRSYADGSAMQEDCNQCECKNGNWSCSTHKCAGVCTAWGDSHITTFDDSQYDFEGVCTYLLAKGVLDGKDGFSVEIQNVPCGTTGATCSKSITLKVGTGNAEEIVSLTKDSPLPDVSKLKRIKLRVVGAYVFLDVPSLSVSLQWDRGVRVYVKANPMWQGRLKGLCGNYNGDLRDDFQPPSGGIPEASALLFVDSWKLKTSCPKPAAVTDHCKQKPERKDWAATKCGELKRHPFSLCHSEVPVGELLSRCETDACACDSGDDCQCVCSALATYAAMCAARGVAFKWRTPERCPMQCDEECSNYDACLSACPLETCDNTPDYAEIKAVCEQDTCVEGCKPKTSCPEGSVYSNSSFTECVPRMRCRRECTVAGGATGLEGDILEEDACHTCRCSKNQRVCTGQPCSSVAPYISTMSPSEPHDENMKCVSGWTPWVNRGPPQTGTQGESVDDEPLPKYNELQIGSPMCQSDKMADIECRTTVNHTWAKDTGANVECSLERGLVCREKGSLCPDFEIRVLCQCEPKPGEPFQCLNSDHPNYPHPTDCSMFYECTPDVTNASLKHAVLKTCGGGLMYNPQIMVCDWPASVVAVRPECDKTEATTEVETTPELESTTFDLPPPPSRCPPGLMYSDCAYPCNQTCQHFKMTLKESSRCTGLESCVDGCIPEQCSKGKLWRDKQTCVPAKDCTCFYNGDIVKPGQVVRDGCKVCQCIENDLHCDTSDCVMTTHIPTQNTPQVRALLTTNPTTPSTVQTTTVKTSTTTASMPTTPLIIVKNTATPPPQCLPDSYKNLLWGDSRLPPSAFSASSVSNEMFQPHYAEINSHPQDNAGSWSPQAEDLNKFIQVSLPRREPVYGVIMQGSPLFDQFVTSYHVMYSDDGTAFAYVEGPDGKPKVFRGPVDHTTPQKQMLEPPVEAKVFRIKPVTWHDDVAVRFELIGCGQHTTVATTPEPLQCTEPLGLAADLPVENIEVSSNNDLRKHFILDGDKGWKPAFSTPGEWIMFDFTSPRNITGVKTKGGPSGWVTAYNIMYTSDLTTFNPVVDNTGSYKIFPGNFDSNSTVISEFRPPIHARYLKVLPLRWNNAIEMRVEPIGCFEPYPVTEVLSETTTESRSCSVCPGVPPPAGGCACRAPLHYDGEGCVSRDQCACVEGYMTYAVGSSFRGKECSECVCKLGGITDCKPAKDCQCAQDLVPKLTESCECLCTPCPEGSRICPTSKICLELEKWCDGLVDCPDDERNCKEKEPLIITTVEPTVVTERATTVAVTVPPTTTTAKPIECPKVECPPGYFVRFTTTSSYSRTTSDLPPPRPRVSYSRYTKGGYSKGGFSKGGYSKGGYSKTVFSKGGYNGVSKGGYAPQIPTTTAAPITSSSQECRQFKCVPQLPPIPKPGSTVAPLACVAPTCPPHYTFKLDTTNADLNQCPQYICVPPPERYAYCNMTGRTFNTFDESEYKFDVCFHILARDAKFNAWSVLVRKICTVDGCQNQLLIQQDDDIILIKPNLLITYNQYEYTVEQTSMICFRENSFDVVKIGNGLAIKSRRYDFGVFFSTDGNVKVMVNTKYINSVDGLCGYYSGNPSDDRRKMDGSHATSIEEFARSWARPGLRPASCEAKLIPPDKQKRAWELCDVITKEPISQCGKTLNLDKWRSICLEKICECTDLVINGTRRSDEECRCRFLETLIAQCLAADKDVDLGDWRMQMDCPADCPAPLIHYDCYRRGCEPTCPALGSGQVSCPVKDGQCHPGCYCPPGKLRKGDECVTPHDCLDCVCNGVGSPAKYVSFEGDDIPYLGNCTYLASRDRNDSGIHTYEVYATNGACDENKGSMVCTQAVHLIYENNVVQFAKDKLTQKLITTINKEAVFKFPIKNDWATITQTNGQDITVLLPRAHVELKVQQSKLEFTVRASSYLYSNRTEGLCGVCAGYLDQLVTSNGTATDDFNEYGSSWQAEPAALTALAVPPSAACGDEVPPPPCVRPPDSPCYVLNDKNRFGKCHGFLPPDSYIESCMEELCVQNDTNVCGILERYAAECRRLHLCLDWRDGLCPKTCESPLVYTPCMTCEETCENHDELKTKKCDQEPVEGCFCPHGKVRVNSTCIEPSKCFPCDANKEHYAGDEWQEDACTKCTCSKTTGSSAHVSCTTQTCSEPVCQHGEQKVATRAQPGECCAQYTCVPKPQALCAEPKQMECGYGQILKQKISPEGCRLFTCECKPASECEHIPTANEVDILEPGMERVIDNSSCCPRALMTCNPAACPRPLPCPLYHELKVVNVTGKCCLQYECEAPKDKCIVSLEWEATPKGGEKLKEKRQEVLKDVESEWQDGPCRICQCARTGAAPAPRCSSPACARIASSPTLVIEPKPVPFACCAEPAYVACRDGDNIYKVGENWTSTADVCESYACAPTADGKLERLTTRQTCHTDCELGWEYSPAEPSSGKCCGKCKPVACVCEGDTHSIGERWHSPDHCTTYTCVEANGTIQVQSSNETCPEVSEEVKKQFVLKEEQVPGKCCKTQEPVACKVGDKIYQEGQSWSSSDACTTVTCARDSSGRLSHRERVQSCARDCQRGWRYDAPTVGQCCGHCVQDACLVEDEIKPPGSTWYSADNCTSYHCASVEGNLVVSETKPSCPDVSACDSNDLVNETCCQVCKEKPQPLSTCAPVAVVAPTGSLRVKNCSNAEPAPDFAQCRGGCHSGTFFNTVKQTHESECWCCQANGFKSVTVTVSCPDGSSRLHKFHAPSACKCARCQGEKSSREDIWKGLKQQKDV